MRAWIAPVLSGMLVVAAHLGPETLTIACPPPPAPGYDGGGAGGWYYPPVPAPPSWVEIDGSATGGGISNSETAASWGSSIATGPGGEIVVAWLEREGFEPSGTGSVYLSRWSGAPGQPWEPLGGSMTGTGVTPPDLAETASQVQVHIGSDGRPVVLWVVSPRSGEAGPTESELGLQIVARKWNGSAWGSLSGVPDEQTIVATGEVGQLSSALDDAGHPVVAYCSGELGAIYVTRWTGTAWSGLVGSESADCLSTEATRNGHPSLRLRSNGTPVVAWTHETTEADGDHAYVYLKAWDIDSGWHGIGPSASGSGLSQPADAFQTEHIVPSLVLDGSDQPIVSWGYNCNNYVYVIRWSNSGASWQQMTWGDAVLGYLPAASALRVACNGAGEIFITWAGWRTDGIQGMQVRLAKWSEQGTWEDLDGSAGENGVSASSYSARSPSIAFDTRGEPIVAWERVGDPPLGDGGAGSVNGSTTEIHLRKHVPANLPPVADASLTPTNVIAAIGAPTAGVLLNGTASADADADALSWSWSVDGALAGTGPILETNMLVNLPHTVILTVTDGRGGMDTDTVLVTVESPAAAATSLIEVVGTIEFSSDTTTSTFLTSTLASASSSFAAGNVGAGINKLQAFQQKLLAKSGKSLSAAEAQELIDLAQEIIDSSQP